MGIARPKTVEMMKKKKKKIDQLSKKYLTIEIGVRFLLSNRRDAFRRRVITVMKEPKGNETQNLEFKTAMI